MFKLNNWQRFVISHTSLVNVYDAQGLWLTVMGFLLYVPKYMSEGFYVIRIVEGGRIIGYRTEMVEKKMILIVLVCHY